MTSTTDTAEHPEVTEISDLAEGLLPPSRTSDIRRHLDGCVLCADVYASLEEIRGMLGTLPGPPRMPEDIATRIDAALAAEALLDSVTAAPEHELAETSPRETTDPVSRETSTTETAEPSLRSTDRPAGHARAATGPGRKSRFTRRRTGAAIGSVLTVAALGVGALLMQNTGGSPTAKAPTSSASDTFAQSTLQTKVSKLLGTQSSSTEPFGTEDTGPKAPGSNSPMKKQAPYAPPCVQQGTQRNEDPLAVEKGTYEGKDAYLVVLPHESDPAHQVTAFIVDSSCMSRHTSTGELLYTHSYKRR
ncbi:anti-sigma factor family protein [Streptomyces longispororuber]|uniref:anti-sigma factor family protein n=1 Tax=Streptomyces longispororuber TaxID=68230 RepID=UPI0021087E7E|nr:hypothetical protein [Streptomyces longispororuber]MCQ4207718.1 hypothetical protein [Streptomyces longispororuber]